MRYFIYDGSMDGYLTALSRGLKDRPDSILPAGCEEEGLFNETVVIASDPALASDLASSIRQRLGQEAMKDVFCCFLAEEPGIEISVLDYLSSLFSHGARASGNYADGAILAVHKMTQKVVFESHRLKGLLRFRKLRDGALYAPVEPDHNVVILLAPHFAKRLRAERWLIHDLKRNTGVLYDTRRWEKVDIAPDNTITTEDYDENEAAIQELWREFFRSIAISERKNPLLQKRMMPRRYWKYLVEMER